MVRFHPAPPHYTIMDFAVVKKAGLSQREFATLCGVSRESTNLWCKGHMKPHWLHAEKIETVLAALDAAVNRGALPLARVFGAEARAAAIKAALSPTIPN